eukprot:scaffold467_cov403-Prasinococcus_capsulatus_cf.AAC.7
MSLCGPASIAARGRQLSPSLRTARRAHARNTRRVTTAHSEVGAACNANGASSSIYLLASSGGDRWQVYETPTVCFD